jgi:WD40-like Beta Propeller Repeat
VSAKDRVIAASEATAASVGQIRPLALPESSTVSTERRKHRGPNRVSRAFARAKGTWLIPLASAAVVVVLALSLGIVRQLMAPSLAPGGDATSFPADPAAIQAIPRYYAIANEGPVSHDEKAAIVVTVGDVRTGQAIASVILPAVSTLEGDNSAIGVSAAGDDRTFIAGRRNTYGGITFFQVRVAPGAKQVATVKQLPIPDLSVGNLLGFAVSPDGTQLAVLSVRGNGTTLGIYSVKTGATLRTWTASGWQYLGGLLDTGVSWTADGRQVAFSTVASAQKYTSADSALEELLIGVTAPSGDLAAASKVMLKAPSDCTSLLLTPDGGTVVCSTRKADTIVNSAAGPHLVRPADCGKTGPMYVAYSAVTGKRLRVLYEYTGSCDEASETALWADASAQHVIGEQEVLIPGAHYDRYAVIAPGTFTKFPVLPLGQWSSGPAF